ncbi:MAG: hypothetical protein M1821_008543 [Bathelium mastoideum]|nr:MAG: hypothetical protein M1821_008543 [Bathelium mastoideum]
MSNDDGRPVDLENPPADLEDVNAPVITELDQMSGTGEEEVLFDGIPTVQKPGYGNWIWAEKRCARRSGLTVGEATAIQAAYRVYQKDGDIEEFVAYIREFLNTTMTSFETSTRIGRTRRLLRIWLNRVLPWFDMLSLLSPFSLTSWTFRAVCKFVLEFIATSRDQRETEQERLHTLEILRKLVELFKDSQSALQEMESQDQEAHKHMDYTLKTNDEKDVPPSSTAPRTERETSQEPATLASTVESDRSKKAKPKSSFFDASKLDRRKFDILVHELLRSRSYESGTQYPPEGLSSPFVVIGWFSKGSSDPYERLVTLNENEDLFKQL